MSDNYQSDIKIRVRFTVGGVTVNIPSHDFCLRFRTQPGGTAYDCSKKDGVYKNCAPDQTNTQYLICSIDGAGFTTGHLYVELFDFVPDDSFADGNMLKVVPCPMGTDIVVGAGDGADIEADVYVEIASQLGEFSGQLSAFDTRLTSLEADMDDVESMMDEEYDAMGYTEITKARITTLKRISDVTTDYNNYSVIFVPVVAGKEYRIKFNGTPNDVSGIAGGAFAALWYDSTPAKGGTSSTLEWALKNGDEGLLANAVMSGETGDEEIEKTFTVTAPVGATHLAVANIHGILNAEIMTRRLVIKEDSMPVVSDLVSRVLDLQETVTDMTTLQEETAMVSEGSKALRISSAGKFKTAGQGVALSYYAVTPGDAIIVRFGGTTPSTLSPTDTNAALSFSDTVPAADSACLLVKFDGKYTKLIEVAGNTYHIEVPDEVSYLCVGTHADLEPIEVVRKVRSVQPQVFPTLPDRVTALETEVFDNSITEEKFKRIDLEARGKYHVRSTTKTINANANASMLFRLHATQVTGGKTYRVTWSGDYSVISTLEGAAAVSAGGWFGSNPQTGDVAISFVLMNGTSAMLMTEVLNNGTIISGRTVKSYEVVAPQGATYLAVPSYEGYLSVEVEELHTYIKEDAIPSSSGAKQDFEWNMPSTIYAIVGLEKRIYFGNITNSFGEALIDIADDTPPTSPILGHNTNDRMLVTGDYLEFTPYESGQAALTLVAHNKMGAKLSEKTITVVALPQDLPSSAKRVCVIGDSITEYNNMAKQTETKFKSVFGDSASGLPIFVGTQGGSSTRHEGHAGHNYHWLISNSNSPFVNNGSLDIANWRATAGIGNYHVDVVSLGMGFNSAIDNQMESEFGYMHTLINAFLEDNEDTIFVVQLCPLTSSGPGVRHRVQKNKDLLTFRKLCLENISNANVIIGDLGCCYDRYYAYRHVLDHPAPYYTSIHVMGGSDVDHLVECLDTRNSGSYQNRGDTTHPSAFGTIQMGESIVPVLLAAMNKSDE